MSFKVQDHYFKKAKREHYLARSVYKLKEIQTKYKIFNKKTTVLDLGYHPGAWCQLALEEIKAKKNKIIVGIDIKDVNTSLQGQHSELILLKKDIFNCDSIEDFNVSKKFDLVLSDMAPNTTGVKLVDQQGSLELVEKVFSLLKLVLSQNGNFVIKVFDGQDAQLFVKSKRKMFRDFFLFKPQATRGTSKELYVIGKGYQE